jgi:hypothetical protein
MALTRRPGTQGACFEHLLWNFLSEHGAEAVKVDAMWKILQMKRGLYSRNGGVSRLMFIWIYFIVLVNRIHFYISARTLGYTLYGVFAGWVECQIEYIQHNLLLATEFRGGWYCQVHWWKCFLTLFRQMSIFSWHTKNDPTVVCRHMIDKFFFAFLWSFVYHISLLAAVAVARHYWMLYQDSAAIWHT